MDCHPDDLQFGILTNSNHSIDKWSYHVQELSFSIPAIRHFQAIFFVFHISIGAKRQINMTEETPQQAARYTSFGHDFQKLVAASSGVSNPVFEMKDIYFAYVTLQ